MTEPAPAPADEALQTWIRTLAGRIADPDPVIRDSARQALLAIGAPANVVLREIERGEDDAASAAARDLIERIASPRSRGRSGLPRSGGMPGRPDGRGGGPGGRDGSPFPTEAVREIRWFDSLQDGIDAAREQGKPIVLILAGQRPTGGCWAHTTALVQGPLSDRETVALLASRFVCVQEVIPGAETTPADLEPKRWKLLARFARNDRFFFGQIHVLTPDGKDELGTARSLPRTDDETRRREVAALTALLRKALDLVR